MTHFVNHREAIVTEAVDGLLATSPPGALARLGGFPTIKVIVRADWSRTKVALISGGGSGHEPAHAGFVGRGALTAAVCGEIFASPSVEAVYTAIRHVTGPSGCLLIVKNYAGDRLNFGLAAERARAEGYKVEVVIVADDVALENLASPRGIAGTLFVHKIAGGFAEAGASLDQVAAVARRVAGAVKSLGVATTACTIPGQPPHARLEPGQAELGLGIHGERGVERIELSSASALAELMSERLSRAIPQAGALALLINNLGGAPDLELAVFSRAVLETALGQRAKWVLGPARLMTSLDMKGVSLSALPIDDALVAALTAPCEAPAWPGARPVGPIAIYPVERQGGRAAPAASDDPERRALLTAICEALLSQEQELNELDARVGDGDTGTTFAIAARAILSALDDLPLGEPSELLAALSDRLSAAMGGTSGALLSIFAASAGHALAQGESWRLALRAGMERMQFYGGAKAGDRTMLDALSPAIQALDEGGDLAAAAQAARAGARATAAMARAHAGRSSYLNPNALTGVADPGATAIAAMFEAAAARTQTRGRLAALPSGESESLRSQT